MNQAVLINFGQFVPAPQEPPVTEEEAGEDADLGDGEGENSPDSMTTMGHQMAAPMDMDTSAEIVRQTQGQVDHIGT